MRALGLVFKWDDCLWSGSAIVTGTAEALLHRSDTGNGFAAVQEAERENVNDWMRTERGREKETGTESGRGSARERGREGWRQPEATEKEARKRPRMRMRRSY